MLSGSFGKNGNFLGSVKSPDYILPIKKSHRIAEIRADFFDSRYGNALIGVDSDNNRIVWLSLVLDKSPKSKKLNLEEMETHWQPDSVKRGVSNHLPEKPGDWLFENGCVESKKVGLGMRGTEFQHQVWNELQKIPPGKTRTYSEIAENLGRPKSHARAIGTAIGKNTIAVLVPCHRVVGANGKLTGFRWGLTRKQVILDWEAAESGNNAI